MTKSLDVLLLLAFPASGKSEVRKYLASLTPEQCRDDFHMGPTAQLDDYPYVHLMRTIAQTLKAMNEDGIFFDADSEPMKEPKDWGTLIELVNEDFHDLVTKNLVAPKHPAQWMLDRFDAARTKVGAKAAFAAMNPELKAKLLAAIGPECEKLVKGKNEGIPETLEGKTVVIEFARGGPDGSKMPLPAPYGYQHALSLLSDELLSRSSILYVWVTPEESRRKNIERSNPAKTGANLHLSLNHSVPLKVMMNEYGCDDMEHLINTSGKPDAVKVQAHGKTYFLPVARFDNRKDKTTFVREPKESWRKDDVKALHDGLAEGFSRLVKA